MPKRSASQSARLSRYGAQYGDNRAATLERYAAQEAYEVAHAAATVVQAYVNAYNDGLMMWRDIPPDVQVVMERMGY
jgi:hypothetical protein